MISIIVPYYNEEKTIERCVKSILGQSFDQLQVIVVNDGSTDRSPAVLRKIAMEDHRIEILNLEHKGVSRARYEGLSKAKGEYVSFVDADDWIEPNYIQTMVDGVEENNADIVVADYYRNDVWCHNGCEKGLYEENGLLSLYSQMIFCLNLDKRVQDYRGIRPTIAGKMFRSDMLKKMDWEGIFDISFGEDGCIVYAAIMSASRVLIIGKALYHYEYDKKKSE